MAAADQTALHNSTDNRSEDASINLSWFHRLTVHILKDNVQYLPSNNNGQKVL